MYTYFIAGMPITDELYHDDLEGMTFGRRDQNELWHYGIKGQKWNRRRFQNEDGSLTQAGRSRYGVGDAINSFANTVSNAVNRVGQAARSSSNSGGSTVSATSGGRTGGGSFNKASAVNKQSFATSNRPVVNRQSVANSANKGRSAADSLFSKVSGAANAVGNWGKQAGKDIGNTATNAYNGVKQGVNAAANWVGNTAKGVASDIQGLANTPEARNAANGINSAIDAVSEFAKPGVDAVGNAAKTAGNWIGDRAGDVADAVKPGINAVGKAVTTAGNWVGDRAGDVAGAAKNAAGAVSDWFTGNKDKRDAEMYNRQAENLKTFAGTDTNIVDYQQANADANRNYANMLGYTRPRAGDVADPLGRDQQWYNNLADDWQRAADYNRMRIDNVQSRANAAQERYDNAPRQVISNAANDVGNWASNAAKDVGNFATNAYNGATQGVRNAANDVGNWASNAAKGAGNWIGDRASDVANWGSGAFNSGKQALQNLFGGRDSSPQSSNALAENRVTGQRIPEQRITEQRIPEQKPTVNGSNNVQTWDNGNINTWDNVQTFGDPDMVNAIKLLNDNGFFNRGSSSSSSVDLSDKPAGVSDEYWRDYKFNGGTRSEWNNRQNSSQNGSSGVDLSDKPAGVSNEYWQEYKSYGGTRDSWEQQRGASQNSSPRSDFQSQQPASKQVDTSRPYHFEFDSNSGQTVVVYDDDKRR